MTTRQLYDTMRRVLFGYSDPTTTIQERITVSVFFNQVFVQGYEESRTFMAIAVHEILGVKKFIYISAFHAERYPHLTYFHVHQQFAERLMRSGLAYTIIKPPALFSAFIDLFELAEKGRLINMGKGDKLTNPVYEGDVAAVCINAITQDVSTKLIANMVITVAFIILIL